MHTKDSIETEGALTVAGATTITGATAITGALSTASTFGKSGAYGSKVEIKEITEVMTIDAAAASNSTAEIPAGAIVLAVASRVTVNIPTLTSWDLGLSGGDDDAFTSAAAIVAGTTSKGNLTCPLYVGSATKVMFTVNGSNPNANTGRLRISILYIDVTAPTS